MSNEFYNPGKRVVHQYLDVKHLAWLVQQGDYTLTGVDSDTWNVLALNNALSGIEGDRVAYLKAAARVVVVEYTIVHASPLDKNTVIPTTRGCLEAEISCRELPSGKGNSGGWSFYWMESGCELTFFSGMEGGYEVADLDDAMECIGGDQPCYLTPASLKRFNVPKHGSTSKFDPFRDR